MKHIVVLNWLDPFSHTPGRTGGAELQLAEIFSRIARSGYQVTFFTARMKGESPSNPPPGIEIVHAGSWRTANYTIPWALRRFCRSTRVDLVVEDINKLPFFSPLYVKKPVVCMVPHLFRSHARLEVGRLAALYIRALENLIPHVYRHSHFVAVSASTAADLADLGIAPGLIRVVHNGVDHASYCLNGDVKSSTPLIVHAGRLKKYKCVDHIVRAMPRILGRFPRARLVIMGDGDFGPDLCRLVKRLNLQDSVGLLGYVDTETKIHYLRQAHVFVNTSSKEGWGLNNIEANACGAPVVAYDSPGLRDSVNSKCGALVPFGNVDKLSDEITDFLVDSEHRDRISRSAVNWAQRFTWDRCAQETLNVLEGVLSTST